MLKELETPKETDLSGLDFDPPCDCCVFNGVDPPNPGVVWCNFQCMNCKRRSRPVMVMCKSCIKKARCQVCFGPFSYQYL